MALGSMSPPQMSTPVQSLAAVPNQTLDARAVKMNPMDSMIMVFEDMRDGISKIPEAIFELKEQVKTSISNLNKHLAYRFTELSKTAQKQMTGTSVPVEDRDDLLGEADADSQGNIPDDTDSQGNGGGFEFPSIPKPGPKLGLALLLGGLAGLMAFGDKMVPYIAPVLKFIKEKALPMAIDAFKAVLEGVKTVFNYLYENVWPFIKDNIIMNAVDYVKDTFTAIQTLFEDLGEKFGTLFSEDATWWEKITAFLGIFGDIGQFFIDQFDRVTEFIANVFGVSFEPYDGLISYISGKLTEGFKVVVDWFSQTGEFLLEGATGIWNWITGMIDTAWTGISTWFSETGEYLLGGAASIVDWLKEKLAVPFAFITDLFSFPESPKEFGTKLIDIILLPYNLAINFLRGIFGFGEDEEGNVEPFSLGEFIVDTVMKVVDFIKNLFSFDLPSVGDVLKGAGDIMQTLLRAVLPSPDFLTFDTPSVTLFGKKFGGGSISLNPIPDALYKAAGIDPETGEMLTPINTDTASETFVDPAERSALEQIKRNQRNMEIYGQGDEDDILRDGHTVESKLFELEMKNAELASQLSGAELKKLQEFQERQGYAQGGGIAVNTFNTDNSQNDNSNTNTTSTLAVEGSDSTARALAYSGFSDEGEY